MIFGDTLPANVKKTADVMRSEAFSNTGGVGFDDSNNNETLEKSFQKSPVSRSDDINSENGSPFDDDMRDLYGPRTYNLGNTRPTMISGKYRQKEERRKMLKLSMNKLKRIEDPESSLCRSVLINNIVKRLQSEAKEDKVQKHQPLSSQSRCFGITNDFIARQEENLMKSDPFSNSLISRTATDQLLDITNIRDPLSKSFGKFSVETDYLETSESIPAELDVPIRSSNTSRPSSITTTATTTVINMSHKRSLDEECDILSQFYLPPTPRMLLSLEDDEDEDINVVDIDTTPPINLDLEHPMIKRRRTGDCCQQVTITAADRLRDNLTPSYLASPIEDWTVDDSVLLHSPNLSSSVSPTHQTSPSPFSCGHSSMLNEIVVYHNLITSLES